MKTLRSFTPEARPPQYAAPIDYGTWSQTVRPNY